MIELLKRKIKILEQELGWKNRHLQQLDHCVRHGKLPPVEECFKEERLYELYRRHREQLHVVDLEIKNMELQAEIDRLKA